MAVSKIQAVFHSDIENVWNIVTSLENYKLFLIDYLNPA